MHPDRLCRREFIALLSAVAAVPQAAVAQTLRARPLVGFLLYTTAQNFRAAPLCSISRWNARVWSR